MANPSPNLDNLTLGRGKRPKTNSLTVSMRMSPLTRKILEEEAARYDCFYGGEPWIAGLLELIGKKELQIVPANPASSIDSVTTDPKGYLKLQSEKGHQSRKYRRIRH